MVALSLPAAARGFDVGLADSVFNSPDPNVVWFDRAAEGRATVVRISVSWSSVASSTRPADPLNPADPSYDFQTVDAAVQKAVVHGLDVLLTIASAPTWAEGENRPDASQAPPGTWKPNPGDLQGFAQALASRYSGDFQGLPRVRLFQLWNEPNLSMYLNPQWEGAAPASPRIYRGMLNAFYAGVKSVSSSDQVLTAGTAPYGDSPGGQRMQPALFWRSLLCLEGHDLRPAECPDPAHFDIAAHNPINADGPTRGAQNVDDISTPDLGRLKRILTKARKTGRSEPGGRKPLWATEFWWESNPPDPNGVPEGKHARWLEQALYLFWKQGVKKAIWFQIRDAAPVPDYGSTYQTGLFQLDGTPKLAYQAFRFPFVTDRLSAERVRIWGMAPAPGRVRVQRKFGPGWHTIARLRAGGDRVFVGKLSLSHRARLRARAGGETSLVWRQR
jgi:hypothetical protein